MNTSCCIVSRSYYRRLFEISNVFCKKTCLVFLHVAEGKSLSLCKTRIWLNILLYRSNNQYEYIFYVVIAILTVTVIVIVVLSSM